MIFTINRPTPTTTLYSVSTRAPITTLPAKLQRLLLTSLRLLTGALILLSLYTKAHTKISSTYPSLAQHVAPLPYPIHDLIGPLAAALPWHLTFPIAATLAFLICRKGYTEESLLVIRGLGVQTSTSSPTYLSTAATRFIPTSVIQDVFIHEAFKGFEVRYYLAIVVEGEESVVVVFPNILPKRMVLERIWRGTRACLYEPKG